MTEDEALERAEFEAQEAQKEPDWGEVAGERLVRAEAALEKIEALPYFIDDHDVRTIIRDWREGKGTGALKDAPTVDAPREP